MSTPNHNRGHSEWRSGERIALFFTSLAGGGAERAMVLLAKGLAERGVSVDLVLTSARGPYLADVPSEVRIVDLGARRISFSLPKLVRYLRQERPPVLISTLSPTNCVALCAKALAQVPTRVIINEQTPPSQASTHTQSWRETVLPKLMRWTYRHADVVTAISSGVADDVAHVCRIRRTEIQVIYNPVITSDLTELANAAIDHPWFAPGEPPVVLGAGRLVQAKDFPTLLRAFALLRQRVNARLMIVGEGEKRESLQVLAQDLGIEPDFAMPGFVSNLYAYMSRSSLFVLSSKWEGLGMVLIEAMACGAPVVSTDCPYGPREILEDGRWGRLTPVGSAGELSEAMLQTLKDRRLDPSDRAAHFSVERAVGQYLQTLFPDG